MMSNALAQIFILFILGLLLTFNAWRSWTRQQFTYRSKRYRRDDNPFNFWFLLTVNILIAALLIFIGIDFSNSLLRP